MIAKLGFFLKSLVFPYFRVTLRYMACFSEAILNTYVVLFASTLCKTWRKNMRTKSNSSFLLKCKKLPFLLYFTGLLLCIQHSAPPKMMHLKVPLKMTQSCVCCWIACARYTYLVLAFLLLLFCQWRIALFSRTGRIAAMWDLLLWQLLFC